ncbi:MAG TPA: glycosyltransferase [Candidatus Saccharimonadia bacterium]|nr:glycosyltransferase [Candidatus Saccharimonadia bacterium]
MSVEVVVPIHGGATVLRSCLDSLARTLGQDVPVQLVDDASQDPAIDRLLAEFAARHRVTRTIVHERNLGFVRSVDDAMKRSKGDVVLLNSDTVVTPGWLERLVACAASDARIATITPFSNNAEICSFPLFCFANPVPADADAIARAAVAAGAPGYPELPTAVGFCMYVRRAALDAVGGFDAATFGRGYGEENDFCLRAAAHGWRNVLCDDAYVVHVGGQSFAPLGERPGGENLARLIARYPRYNAQVAEFIARDPLAARRAAIAARLGRDGPATGPSPAQGGAGAVVRAGDR